MFFLNTVSKLRTSPENVKSEDHPVDVCLSSGGDGLVIEASPVPAGAVEACSDEQDDQQSDEEPEADHGGGDGPDQRPLRHVDQRGAEGHARPACPPPVLRRVPGQVDPLHAQRADQTRPVVAQLVEGVFAVVPAHTALTWGRGEKRRPCSNCSCAAKKFPHPVFLLPTPPNGSELSV